MSPLILTYVILFHLLGVIHTGSYAKVDQNETQSTSNLCFVDLKPSKPFPRDLFEQHFDESVIVRLKNPSHSEIADDELLQDLVKARQRMVWIFKNPNQNVSGITPWGTKFMPYVRFVGAPTSGLKSGLFSCSGPGQIEEYYQYATDFFSITMYDYLERKDGVSKKYAVGQVYRIPDTHSMYYTIVTDGIKELQ
jgi:hypothetical protein